MESKAKTEKTTVSFPINLLMALRAYMLQKGLSSHKQSEIVAKALREYLEKEGIEIPSDNGKSYKYEVKLIS